MNETISAISVNNVLYDVEDPRITGSDITAWNNKQDALTFNTTPSSSNKVATMADIPSSIPSSGGNADTVNNHTVLSDVPADAVFTDNNTTYKFTIGSTTNGDSANGTSLGTLTSESAEANGTTLSLVTTGEKATWNAKSSFSGSYSDLTDKPTIPTSVSQLTNDTGFVSSLSGYATETWVSNKLNDILGIDASGVSALTTALSDSDTATGILNAIASKQDSLVFNTAYDASTNKVATMLDIPSTLPASDVSSWAKQSSKPSYNYSEISYAATAVSGSGALTLAGTYPIYVVTVTANISSVSLTANPSAGHSCHIFFVTDSSDSTDRTVAIAHDSTNRVCPNAEDISFTVPKNAGGYVEVDFLNANNKVYVRGV